MENEKPKEETKKETAETPTQDINAGSEPQTASIIERASAERQKLEATLAEVKKENDRRERIASELILSGHAEAGVVTPKIEVSPEEYAKGLLSGKTVIKE